VSGDAFEQLAAIMPEMVRAAAFRAELRRFLARTETVATRADLTPRRYDLLLAIGAGDPDGIPVGELAATLQMRQPATSELLNRAEAAGLIERHPSATDGRVRLVRLTEEGARRLQQAFLDLRIDRDMLWSAFNEVDRAFRRA
jgi:DNA-binding MarR family transcriptional regulator